MKKPHPPMNTRDLVADGTLIGGNYKILNCRKDWNLSPIYEANHLGDGHSVILKVIDIEAILDRVSGDTLPAAVFHRWEKGLLLKAETMAAIIHPNVACLEDFGRCGMFPGIYLGFKKISGRSLKDFSQEGESLSARRVLTLFLGFLDGLAACHCRGIVHGCIHPENLFVTLPPSASTFGKSDVDGEKIVILDVIGRASVDEVIHLAASKTRVGWQRPGFQTIFGYISPEFARRDSADSALLRPSPASDVFSSALVLSELLSGQPVLGSEESPFFKAIRIATGDFRLPESILNGPFGDILTRALAINPSDRFPTAAEFAAALRTISPNCFSLFFMSISAHGPDEEKPLGRPFFRAATLKALGKDIEYDLSLTWQPKAALLLNQLLKKLAISAEISVPDEPLDLDQAAQLTALLSEPKHFLKYLAGSEGCAFSLAALVQSQRWTVRVEGCETSNDFIDAPGLSYEISSDGAIAGQGRHVDKGHIRAWLALRECLAQASIAEYHAALKTAKHYWNTEDFALRGLLAYLFPEERTWSESVANTILEGVNAENDPGSPYWGWCLLASLKDKETSRRLAQILPIDGPWSEFIPQVITLYGAEAVALLAEILQQLEKAGKVHWMTVHPWRESLALIENIEAGILFCRYLDDSQHDQPAATYFRRFPEIAMMSLSRFLAQTDAPPATAVFMLCSAISEMPQAVSKVRQSLGPKEQAILDTLYQRVLPGQEAQLQAIPTVLQGLSPSTHPSCAVPPPFLKTKGLRRPILREEVRALPLFATEHLIRLLFFSDQDKFNANNFHAQIELVRDACTGLSLTEFVEDLVTAFTLSGEKEDDLWIIRSLAYLGDAAAQTLARKVRSWSRDNLEENWAAGLQALETIGTDLALAISHGLWWEIDEIAPLAEEHIMRLVKTLHLSSTTMWQRFWPTLPQKCQKETDRGQQYLARSLSFEERWDTGAFRLFVVEQPWIGRLAQRVIFASRDSSGIIVSFRISPESKRYLNSSGIEVVLTDPSRISLPSILSNWWQQAREERTAWKKALAEAGIEPLFDQF